MLTQAEMNANPNYVFVDYDGWDAVRVYTNDVDGATREFPANQRLAAERYAAKLAAKLRCDWGTNY